MTPDRAEIEKIADDCLFKVYQENEYCPYRKRLDGSAFRGLLEATKATIEALTAQSSKHEAEKEALGKEIERLKGRPHMCGDPNSCCDGMCVDLANASNDIQSLETLLAKMREGLKSVQEHLEKLEDKKDYDWNSDPLYLTLIQGTVSEALSLTPSTIQDQIAEKQAEIERLKNENRR